MLTAISLIHLRENNDLDEGVIFLSNENEIPFLPLKEKEKSFVKNQLYHNEKEMVQLANGQYRILVVRQKNHPEGSYQLEYARRSGAKSWAYVEEFQHPKICHFGKSDKLFLSFIEGLCLSSYRFEKYKSKKKNSPGSLEVYCPVLDEQELKQMMTMVSAVFCARDLVNEPVIFLDAVQLSKEIVRLGKEFGFDTEVLDKNKIASLKMEGLLAVNAGSEQPPTFTILRYRPVNKKIKKPVVLVGKGIVYDTGGLSLKPTPNSMDMMKSDMAGAAAVVGAICAVAKLELPVEVIGLIPATDNRPGKNAVTPGDIITFANKKTVEILNTDAEGRLVLADALLYAGKYDPHLVIDLATLTGSAMGAIGKEGAVMMGKAYEGLKTNLKNAGLEVFERLVEFPLWEEYGDQLESSIADMTNLGGTTAGAITAGKFLEQFIDYEWIHIDIAGPSFDKKGDTYKTPGGSGFGVRLISQYLINITN